MTTHKITIKLDEFELTVHKIRSIIKKRIPSPWNQFISHGESGDRVQRGFLAYSITWDRAEAGLNAPNIDQFWNDIANIYK